MLGGRKTVIFEFLGTGMISVMPVPLFYTGNVTVGAVGIDAVKVVVDGDVSNIILVYRSLAISVIWHCALTIFLQFDLFGERFFSHDTPHLVDIR